MARVARRVTGIVAWMLGILSLFVVGVRNVVARTPLHLPEGSSHGRFKLGGKEARAQRQAQGLVRRYTNVVLAFFRRVGDFRKPDTIGVLPMKPTERKDVEERFDEICALQQEIRALGAPARTVVARQLIEAARNMRKDPDRVRTLQGLRDSIRFAVRPLYGIFPVGAKATPAVRQQNLQTLTPYGQTPQQASQFLSRLFEFDHGPGVLNRRD